MTHDEKIELLRKLEEQGVVWEDCPTPEWWPFRVLKPESLPEQLRDEFERLGEIRW